jgi:phosphatidylethanolamine/phosphatidyl-N-methylethanolamine N-methyltransferase
MQPEPRKKAVALPRPIDPAAGFVDHPGRGRDPARFGDRLAFLRGFLARPIEVASVVPSSVYLERRVVQAAQLAMARCVVELGPGTGGTTRALLGALGPRAQLLSIELNPAFCARLRRRVHDPRLLLQSGSAEALPEFLARWGLPAPEAIVSGIPFSTMPADSAQRIAAAIMGAPQTAWEWRNVPPMRVFRWVKSPAGGGAGGR